MKSQTKFIWWCHRIDLLLTASQVQGWYICRGRVRSSVGKYGSFSHKPKLRGGVAGIQQDWRNFPDLGQQEKGASFKQFQFLSSCFWLRTDACESVRHHFKFANWYQCVSMWPQWYHNGTTVFLSNWPHSEISFSCIASSVVPNTILPDPTRHPLWPDPTRPDPPLKNQPKIFRCAFGAQNYTIGFGTKNTL